MNGTISHMRPEVNAMQTDEQIVSGGTEDTTSEVGLTNKN